MNVISWATKYFYEENKVGAIDIIAVKRGDNSISCGPFHVRMNSSAKKHQRKIVDISINESLLNLPMRLGESGEAFFLERTESINKRPRFLNHNQPVPLDSPALTGSITRARSYSLNDAQGSLEDNFSTLQAQTQDIMRVNSFGKEIGENFSINEPLSSKQIHSLTASLDNGPSSSEVLVPLVIKGSGSGSAVPPPVCEQISDIPNEEICPEPASGDLYDSDNDSFASIDSFSSWDGDKDLDYEYTNDKLSSSLDLSDVSMEASLNSPSTSTILSSPINPSSDRNKNDINPSSVSPPFAKPKYRYRKVLIPSKEKQKSEILSHLHWNSNKVLYTCQGCPSVSAELFLWPEDARIVVIDIEGAIKVTPSTSIWDGILYGSRSTINDGVVRLLQDIERNGYKILYLTRNASNTKDKLHRSLEGSGCRLPSGPVIYSPECLLSSKSLKEQNLPHISHPEIFKAAVLRGLKSLFPANHSPFYACFGSSEKDMSAFSSCGVSEGKTFVISPKGEIGSVNRTLKWSFSDMHKFLDEIFPPIADSNARKENYKVHNAAIDGSYTDFNYWRLPTPLIH